MLILDREISTSSLVAGYVTGSGWNASNSLAAMAGRLPLAEGHLAASEDSISHVRKFAPRVLTAVELDGGVAAQDPLSPVTILTGSYRNGVRHVLDGARVGFVAPCWQEYLDWATDSVDRIAYATTGNCKCSSRCLTALRSGDVFVPGSRRYSDPTAFLLDPPNGGRGHVARAPNTTVTVEA